MNLFDGRIAVVYEARVQGSARAREPRNAAGEAIVFGPRRLICETKPLSLRDQWECVCRVRVELPYRGRHLDCWKCIYCRF